MPRSFRNFRATEYMAADGLAGFSHWHDDRAWHPAGRTVADTMPAGLPWLTARIHAAGHAVGLTPDLYHTAVFIGPVLAVRVRGVCVGGGGGLGLGLGAGSSRAAASPRLPCGLAEVRTSTLPCSGCGGGAAALHLVLGL